MTQENDAMLYQEVYGAQEKLIAQAKELIKKPLSVNALKEKVMQKLSEVGFYQAISVKNYLLEANKKSECAQKLKVMEAYKIKYPFHKFIDRETVDYVCTKYGLYLTKAVNYIGEIPDNKAEEIANFVAYDNDVREPSEAMSDFERINSYSYDFRIRFAGEPKSEPKKISGKNLCIIAPEEKIDTRNLIKDGRVLRSNDPIVLQPVHHGYIIVSSWGLEASDPQIINQINN